MRVLGMARLKLTLLRVLRRLDRVLLKVRRKTKAQLHPHMGKQPNDGRGVNFSPVSRGVVLGGGRVRVRFCSQGGGRVWEKITKKANFYFKKDYSTYNPILQKSTAEFMQDKTLYMMAQATKDFKNSCKSQKFQI